MGNKICYVGAWQCANENLAQLYAHGLMIKAFHTPYVILGQDCDFPNYDIDNYVDEGNKVGALKQFLAGDQVFISLWDGFWVMQQMEQAYPELKFIVGIRDAITAANAMRNFKLAQQQSEPQRYGNIVVPSVNEFLKFWIRLYQFVAKQAKQMKQQPMLFSYERYIRGEYNQFLLDLLGLPKSKLAIIEEYRKAEQKLGEVKELIKPAPKLVKQAKDVLGELEADLRTRINDF